MKRYSTICPMNKREENAKRLRKAIANDMEDQRELYKILLKYSETFIINPSEREDFVSKYLFKMMNGKVKQFRYVIEDSNQITENHRFMRWTYVVFKNLCKSHLKPRKVKERNFTYFEKNDNGYESNTYKPYNVVEAILEQKLFDPPEQEVIKEESARKVRENILNLNDVHKNLILMFYFDRLKYREITDKLDIPIGTVKSQLARARKKLEKLLLKTEDSTFFYTK